MMPPDLAPAGGGHGSRNTLETSLTRALRFELASEEGRVVIGSWTVSALVGLLWILLVIFGPRTSVSHLLPPEDRPIEVRFEEPPPPPAPTPVVAPEPTPAPTTKPAAPSPSAAERAKAREAAHVAQIGAAFGAAPGNGPVGDVSNVLRGVDVHASGVSTPGGMNGGKTVLAYGQGGTGVRSPGRTDIGGVGAGEGIGAVGNVGAGAGIGHAGVAVSAPRAVAGAPLGSPGRDVGALGNAVREHEPQLRFCYQEYGLKANPSLAGSVTLALTIDVAGTITGVTIPQRTWAGSGVSATEGCILDKVRAWRFPSAAGGAGTYEFSFNFTN
jgi:hypothetical protein